mgnify:CR=1 FL=1
MNIFDKPKKDEPVRDDNTDAQIDDVQNNIDDMPGDEIQDYAESDIFPYLKGKDLETAKMFVDDIEDSGSDFVRSADVRADLKDLFDKIVVDYGTDITNTLSNGIIQGQNPLKIAREKKMITVGFTGEGGGKIVADKLGTKILSTIPIGQPKNSLSIFGPDEPIGLDYIGLANKIIKEY